MWVISSLKTLLDKLSHLELNQYTQKFSYTTTISFSQKHILNFDFEGYFHLTDLF